MTKMSGTPRQGVAETYNDILTWQVPVVAGVPAVPLVDRRTMIFSVLVQNPSTSPATAFVGNNDLQPIELVAGNWIKLNVRDAALIYVFSAGNVTLNCIAEI